MQVNNRNDSRKSNPGHDQTRETAPVVPGRNDEHNRSGKEKAANGEPTRGGTPEVAAK